MLFNHCILQILNYLHILFFLLLGKISKESFATFLLFLLQFLLIFFCFLSNLFNCWLYFSLFNYWWVIAWLIKSVFAYLFFSTENLSVFSFKHHVCIIPDRNGFLSFFPSLSSTITNKILYKRTQTSITFLSFWKCST